MPLNIMRHADQHRPMPAKMQTTVSKSSIVKAATHPDPCATTVEYHERHQHHIEMPCPARLARTHYRLRNAEPVGTQHIASSPLAEPQPVAGKGMEHWKIDRLADMPCMLHERAQVEFAIAAEVHGDRPCLAEAYPGCEPAPDADAVVMQLSG